MNTSSELLELGREKTKLCLMKDVTIESHSLPNISFPSEISKLIKILHLFLVWLNLLNYVPNHHFVCIYEQKVHLNVYLIYYKMHQKYLYVQFISNSNFNLFLFFSHLEFKFMYSIYSLCSFI